MKDSIKVYSLPTCGMCKALKRELENRHIEFEDCQDLEYMQSIGISHAPVLEVNGARYNFKDALVYIKENF